MKTVASELASYMADRLSDECPERCRIEIRAAFCAGVLSGLWMEHHEKDDPATIANQAKALYETVTGCEA